MTARPFQRIPDEGHLEYGLRVWRLFRGAPHVRLSSNLLFVGFALLSTPIWWPLVLSVMQYLESFAPNIQSNIENVDNIASYAGLFCVVIAPVVFIIGEKSWYSGRINTNLLLTKPEVLGVEGINALRYQAEVIPFFGRDKELTILQEFVDDTVAVSWMAMGGPGATGKSRLASEFCRCLRDQEWQAGFWTPDLHSDLKDWCPQAHHFVVMDYVLADEEKAAALINRAHILTNDGNSHKIRVLLIDRDAVAVSVGVTSQRTTGLTLHSLESADSPFQLKSLDAATVQHAIDEFGGGLGLNADQIASIQRVLGVTDPPRRLVLGTMMCLFADSLSSGEKSWVEVVRELIQQEISRWSEFEFDARAERYLLLATVSGGIPLDDLSRITNPTLEFLQSFNQVTAYERVVGESAAHYLAPLSHDLVGELYVLDNLVPAALNDPKLMNELINLGLGVNNGLGLVTFFTRAANDYPDHPALALLITQFSNQEPGFLVWLLIMANVIDKIPLPVDDKISTFQSITTQILSLTQPGANLPIVLNGLFLRLLVHITEHHGLATFVGEYRIVEVATESPPEPTAPTDQLYPVTGPPIDVFPANYCRLVIEALDKVPMPDRSRMANPHLLDVYTHALLWTVSRDPLDPVQVCVLVDGAMHNFNDQWIPGLSQLLTNTIAGLINFDHARRSKSESIGVVNHILSTLSNRNHVDSTALCYSAASAALRMSHVDLQTIKLLVRKFDERFSQVQIESSSIVAEARISLSVAFMYGFQSSSDYREAHELARDVFRLCSKYPTPENIEHTNLTLGQLIRYQGDLSNDSEKIEVLDWLLAHSETFGIQYPKIAELAMGELSSRVSSADTSTAIRERLYNDAMNLANAFANQSFNGRLHMGSFVSEKVMLGIKQNDQPALENLATDVRLLQNLVYVEIGHSSLSSITSEFLRCWNEAKNSQDSSRMRLIGEVSKIWLKTVDLAGMFGVLEYIKNEFDHG